MDAVGTYQRALGALWHAEVAHGELAASSLGSPGLRSGAADHLNCSLNDLASVHAAGQFVNASPDVVVALRHLSNRNINDPATSTSLATVLPHLMQTVRHAAQSVAPASGMEHFHVPLVPTKDAPAHERGAVVTAAAARRMNQVSATQREGRRDLLQHGELGDAPTGWVGGDGNANGAMPVENVHDAQAPIRDLRAVHRPITAKPAQEEFHYTAAAALGIDHLIAPVARRADGTALVELVPGKAAWDPSQNIRTAADVRDTLEHGYRLRYPNLPELQVKLAARVDHELLMYLDWRTANVDRNLGSIVAHRAQGHIGFFDGGEVGQGELRDVTRPAMRESLAIGGSGGHVNLAPETLAEIRARDTDRALEQQHDVLLDARGDDTPGDTGDLLKHLRNSGFLRTNQARRDSALATGSIRYQPISEDANPLDAIWDLRNQEPLDWPAAT